MSVNLRAHAGNGPRRPPGMLRKRERASRRANASIRLIALSVISPLAPGWLVLRCGSMRRHSQSETVLGLFRRVEQQSSRPRRRLQLALKPGYMIGPDAEL